MFSLVPFVVVVVELEESVCHCSLQHLECFCLVAFRSTSLLNYFFHLSFFFPLLNLIGKVVTQAKSRPPFLHSLLFLEIGNCTQSENKKN